MAANTHAFFLSLPPALLVPLACLAPVTLSTGLTWPQPVHTETLAPGAESAEVRFAFKNTGKTTVEITGLHTSCGCTTARADSRSYAPGAEGVVMIKFEARGGLGLQTGTVTVATDEPDREPYQLTLNLTFTDWVTLTPRLVRWTLGSATETRRIMVETPRDSRVELLRVDSPDPAFTARLVASEGPRPAAVEITPRSTATPARAVITLTLRPEGRTEITRSLYAQIR